MNYTITFNPALDYFIETRDFKEGALNRIDSETYLIGGKGLNVSLLLSEFGIASCALGFMGGFTGNYLTNLLKKHSIAHDFIEVNGQTRINVKLKSKKETELNAKGPRILRPQYEAFFSQLKQKLKKGDTVFLSGNLAPGMEAKDYERIGELCQKTQVNFILDSNRELVTSCLTYRPFLIKPNQQELADIFNSVIHTDKDVIKYAKRLQQQGAQNVLVSLGADGAILLTSDSKIYRSKSAPGKLVNSVGAGDSMLAGFMAEYQSSKSFKNALKVGTAAGAATAFSLGIAERKLMDSLVDKIKIQEL
ncbi:1-phosphofructokinase [Facklamia sp. P13064]|uniref:1-phosphofructokinase n=1 Tax=Facklamia sp. P13064 TaxID=3421953 RepID=UPI003D17FD01